MPCNNDVFIIALVISALISVTFLFSPAQNFGVVFNGKRVGKK